MKKSQLKKQSSGIKETIKEELTNCAMAGFVTAGIFTALVGTPYVTLKTIDTVTRKNDQKKVAETIHAEMNSLRSGFNFPSNSLKQDINTDSSKTDTPEHLPGQHR